MQLIDIYQRSNGVPAAPPNCSSRSSTKTRPTSTCSGQQALFYLRAGDAEKARTASRCRRSRPEDTHSQYYLAEALNRSRAVRRVGQDLPQAPGEDARRHRPPGQLRTQPDRAEEARRLGEDVPDPAQACRTCRTTCRCGQDAARLPSRCSAASTPPRSTRASLTVFQRRVNAQGHQHRPRSDEEGRSATPTRWRSCSRSSDKFASDAVRERALRGDARPRRREGQSQARRHHAASSA